MKKKLFMGLSLLALVLAGCTEVDPNSSVTTADGGTSTGLTTEVSTSEEPTTSEVVDTTTEVVPASVTITSEGNATSLNVNENLQLSVVVMPEGVSQKVTWKSSDEEVALVVNGLVVGIKAGLVTITATAIAGVEDSIELEVIQPFVPALDEVNAFIVEEWDLEGVLVPDMGIVPDSVESDTTYIGIVYEGDFAELFAKFEVALEATTWELDEAAGEDDIYYVHPVSEYLVMNVYSGVYIDYPTAALIIEISYDLPILEWPALDVAMLTGIETVPAFEGADEYAVWDFSFLFGELFAGVDVINVTEAEVAAYTELLVAAGFVYDESQGGYLDPTEEVVVAVEYFPASEDPEDPYAESATVYFSAVVKAVMTWADVNTIIAESFGIEGVVFPENEALMITDYFLNAIQLQVMIPNYEAVADEAVAFITGLGWVQTGTDSYGDPIYTMEGIDNLEIVLWNYAQADALVMDFLYTPPAVEMTVIDPTTLVAKVNEDLLAEYGEMGVPSFVFDIALIPEGATVQYGIGAMGITVTIDSLTAEDLTAIYLAWGATTPAHYLYGPYGTDGAEGSFYLNANTVPVILNSILGGRIVSFNDGVDIWLCIETTIEGDTLTMEITYW